MDIIKINEEMMYICMYLTCTISIFLDHTVTILRKEEDSLNPKPMKPFECIIY